MNDGLNGARGLSRHEFLFFGGIALLVYLRLMYRVSYFPPYFEGEEAQSLDLARDTCQFAALTHSWWEAVRGSMPQYNKGYVWLVVPLYLCFGYDVRIITFALPVLFSIFVAAFFALFRRAYPRTHLAAFVLVALFSVLCLCLRRYKWHSVTYVTAISVYVYFLPLYSRAAAERARLFRGLGITLFLVSCFFYYGGLIYAAPLLGLVIAYSGRDRRRREILWAFTWLALFTVAAVCSYNFDDVWHLRIHEVLSFTLQIFSREGLLERWVTLREYFATLLLSAPFLCLLAAGLVLSVRRMRQGDRFAQINTVLFLSIWCFELLIGGVSNLDQLNWSMIPTLGLLLIGADAGLGWIQAKYRHGLALGMCLVAVAAWNEMRRYPGAVRGSDEPYVQDRNTMAQAALILRMIRDDPSESVQYYLPDASVTEADGGFNYDVTLRRADYAGTLERVVFFKGEEDLRRRILAQRRDRWAVIYLSVGFPADGAKDTVQEPLLGQRPTLIHPYEDIYEIQFLVRRFRMRPAQVPRIPTDGMAMWLESTDGTQGPGALRVWTDQTGHGNDATAVRENQPPRVVPNQVNGLPAVRFDGANALTLQNGLMQKAGAAHIVAVVRIGSDPDDLNVLWNLGTGWGTSYKDSAHFEDFGCSDTNAMLIEDVGQIDRYFVYDTSLDSNGILINRCNGLALWTKHVPETGFQTLPDIGGYGDGSFHGEIAEILLYRKPLTMAEQAAVYTYLARKFGMPDIVRNLEAPVLLTVDLEAQVGKPCSHQLAATNNPDRFEASGVPPGLTLGPSGLISGIPTGAGTYRLNVHATNALGTGSSPITLTVHPR